MPFSPLLSEEFLRGVAEAIELNDLFYLNQAKPGLLSLLVADNPFLATSPVIWRLPVNEQHEVLKAVAANVDLGGETARQIISAMLEAGSDTLAQDIETWMGDEAVSAVLDWVDTSTASMPEALPLGWARLLQSRPTAVLAWLRATESPRDGSLELAAGVVDPHSPAVHRLGTGIWERFTRWELAELGGSALTKITAFMLAVGLDNPKPHPYELVAWAFQAVHDAAEKDELPYESWLQLEAQLPSLSRWRQWDKCERLRRALVQAFREYGWPVEYFLKAAKRADTLAEIVRYCQYRAWGQTFLHEVATKVFLGEASASDAQRSLLAEFR